MSQMTEEVVKQPEPSEPQRPRVHLARPLADLVRPDTDQAAETSITVASP